MNKNPHQNPFHFKLLSEQIYTINNRSVAPPIPPPPPPRNFAEQILCITKQQRAQSFIPTIPDYEESIRIGIESCHTEEEPSIADIMHPGNRMRTQGPRE